MYRGEVGSVAFFTSNGDLYTPERQREFISFPPARPILPLRLAKEKLTPRSIYCVGMASLNGSKNLRTSNLILVSTDAVRKISREAPPQLWRILPWQSDSKSTRIEQAIGIRFEHYFGPAEKCFHHSRNTPATGLYPF